MQMISNRLEPSNALQRCPRSTVTDYVIDAEQDDGVIYID